MTEAKVLELCAKTLYLIMVLSAPMLISSLVVGTIISIIQATTQIQEQTISFVPKVVVVFVSALVTGRWMASQIAGFMIEIINLIPQIAGR